MSQITPLAPRPKKKLDRRQRRTRKLLSAALLELIHEKGFTGISIQEITDRADLNRATFYLHYGSKDELLVDALEARFDKLVEQMDEQMNSKPMWESDTADLLVFEHVAQHADFYKLLFNDQSAGYIVQKIIDYIAAVGMKEIDDNLPEQSPLEKQVLSYHYAGSLYALIYWWLSHDMPISPAEMAGWSYRLCILGAAPYLAEANEDEPNVYRQLMQLST